MKKENKTKEIVINRCWGGYGLSHEAIMLYAKLKGFKLYPFVDEKREELGTKYIPYTGQKDVFLVHYSKTPLTKDGKYEESSYFSDSHIERDDPILIKVVKELKEKANGRWAELKIIKIPIDIDYEINDYDGMESIHEKHRKWE